MNDTEELNEVSDDEYNSLDEKYDALAEKITEVKKKLHCSSTQNR